MMMSLMRWSLFSQRTETQRISPNKLSMADIYVYLFESGEIRSFLVKPSSCCTPIYQLIAYTTYLFVELCQPLVDQHEVSLQEPASTPRPIIHLYALLRPHLGLPIAHSPSYTLHVRECFHKDDAI